ncbi:EAL domain-containing protein [Pseudomonas sp. MRSN 12121]|uniref:EAL domain-containing protein n=1 Tax=Pseudomonas sp. MRSN 12121 TaxID=1611770 RepID=UPI0009E1FCE5|nr:EAL domain-containing protein [Pseudomonas sp. MRSN 12121]
MRHITNTCVDGLVAIEWRKIIARQINPTWHFDTADPPAPADASLYASQLATEATMPNSSLALSDCAPSCPLSPSVVRRALFDDEFVAFYQPKVCIDTGQLVGVEVLARWNRPAQGLVSPADFLPALESLGLLDELFRRMLVQALGMRRHLLARGLELDLAFNVHPGQLQQAGFANALEQLLKQQGCPARAITLEILETAALEPSGLSYKNLLQLRLMGANVSMDDFGSGFSSLQRLCELPFNEIKLDASFLRQLDSNAKVRAVIQGTVKLAGALQIRLVVEGVETRQQLAQLLALGCSTAQGYLFARPMPAQKFIQFCLHRSPSSLVSL